MTIANIVAINFCSFIKNGYNFLFKYICKNVHTKNKIVVNKVMKLNLSITNISITQLIDIDNNMELNLSCLY